MDTPILISVDGEGITVDGRRLPTPPRDETVVELLGKPDRIDTGDPPAPVGHRNNEAYIYDKLGFYFVRHHSTGLMSFMTVVYRPGRMFPPPNHMPASCFDGIVEFPQGIVSADLDADAVFRLWKEPMRPIFWGAFYIGELGALKVQFQFGRDGNDKKRTVLSSIMVDYGNAAIGR